MLSQDCYSEWDLVPAKVPLRTNKLGPWLIAIMVNNLDTPRSEL